MSDLTSAQRLAAYRDELRDAGFSEDQVAYLVGIAAPHMEDVEVQADLEDPPLGEVRVRLKAELDKDDIARLVERVQAYVNDASR